MSSTANQPQAPNDEYRKGYTPQQSPEYSDMGNASPQSSYQQQYEIQQPWQPPVQRNVSSFERSSMGMKARTAGLLCYLFAWVGGLAFLLLERDNRFVRFHAMQSVLFFGTMSILTWVCNLFPFALFGLGGLLGLVSFIAWIVLMVMAYRGRYYKLPFFGDYAEKWMDRVKL